jgi:hypothetical protein
MAETEAVIASWADGTGPTLPIVYNATAHSFTGGQVSVANQINATGPVGLVMSGAGQNQQWFAKGNAGGTTPMEGSFWLDPGLQAAIQFNCDGQLFRLRSTGNADKAVAGQWNGLSDIRLKEDVAPLSYGLDEILKLNPITFRLKDRNRKFGDGPLNVSVSAQDAEAVMPQMVYREPDEKLGEILGIRPDFIQYALVNAVKTLNERIAKLEGA